MNIAYCLSAFSDPVHLARLICALDGADTEFFVHIDRKVDAEPFRQACAASNVHFLGDRQRVRVYWGTYAQVEFQMRLIRAALDSPRHNDHIFMLSGQDFPLWPNSRIRTFLQEHPGESQLAGICLDSDDVAECNKHIYRLVRPQLDWTWLSATWNDRLSRLWRKVLKVVGCRQALHFTVDSREWRLFKGSDYFCLTRSLAQYAYEQWSTHPEVRRYFSRSFAPSETCIHTIAFNSPDYSRQCSLHHGPYQSLAVLTPLHCIDYDPVIRIWRDGDLDHLLQSGKMFGRKFTTADSTPLLDAIEQHNHDRN